MLVRRIVLRAYNSNGRHYNYQKEREQIMKNNLKKFIAMTLLAVPMFAGSIVSNSAGIVQNVPNGTGSPAATATLDFDIPKLTVLCVAAHNVANHSCPIISGSSSIDLITVSDFVANINDASIFDGLGSKEYKIAAGVYTNVDNVKIQFDEDGSAMGGQLILNAGGADDILVNMTINNAWDLGLTTNNVAQGSTTLFNIEGDVVTAGLSGLVNTPPLYTGSFTIKIVVP